MQSMSPHRNLNRPSKNGHCREAPHRRILDLRMGALPCQKKRLEMENELLRELLRAVGRKRNQVFKRKSLIAADRPNTKWVTAISCIHKVHGVLSLSMIPNLFGNGIVSYKTGAENNPTCHSKRDGRRGATPHSVQGLQYTSRVFFSLTKEAGRTPSMSRRGNCHDNAAAENFHSFAQGFYSLPICPGRSARRVGFIF